GDFSQSRHCLDLRTDPRRLTNPRSAAKFRMYQGRHLHDTAGVQRFLDACRPRWHHAARDLERIWNARGAARTYSAAGIGRRLIAFFAVASRMSKAPQRAFFLAQKSLRIRVRPP